MKLLYFSAGYLPDLGGVETLAALALPRLIQRGYRVKVITTNVRPNHPDHEFQDWVEICRFPVSRMLKQNHHVQMLGLIKKLRKIKQEFSPDCIHINVLDPALMLLQILNSEQTPVLAAIHNEVIDEDLPLIRNATIKRVMGSAQWVTSVCQTGLDTFRAVYPEIKDKSSVVENGLDVSLYSAPGEETTPPVILCAGRLVKQKGFDLALRIFRQISIEVPGCTLVIAGSGDECPALHSLAGALGIEDRVSFIGEVPRQDMPALLSKAAVVLMPSRYEGMPLLAMEAAAAGKPVVAFAVGETPRIVRHGVSGFLVSPEDEFGIKESLVCLLSDPSLRRDFGTAARRWVESEFGIERYVDEYDRLYQACRRGVL